MIRYLFINKLFFFFKFVIGFIFIWFALCKKLQKVRIDLKQSIELVEDVIDCLQNLRINTDEEFNLIFKEVKLL